MGAFIHNHGSRVMQLFTGFRRLLELHSMFTETLTQILDKIGMWVVLVSFIHNHGSRVMQLVTGFNY